ncbi:MAG: sodium:solute symporter family protein, partial [Parasporobacterium sp.]|nr:sodium:solute symporter family protein [Parasporobacterium sp.]
MSVWHIIGIAVTFLAIIAVSFFSGRKVKSGADFDAAGGKAGAGIVTGAILGTLVGGSSTVGTAQLAYDFGMSAWWFTLGGGIACLLLAIFFVKPLRHAKSTTLVGIIADEYGEKAGLAASILSSIGTFINILSQLIAATAIIEIIFPNISLIISMAIAVALMIVYVIFGGMLSVGSVGVVKLILLFVAVIAGAGFVLYQSNGISLLWDNLDHATYFNLFARGVGKDGGAALSLILGVFSTQSYAQALLMGKSDRSARCGAVLSAALIPLIGIGGILIGEYMRVTEPTLASAKMAFPQFITEHMPPVLAGIILATLIITVVGTGSGLSLGICTVINRDIVKKRTHRFDDPKKNLVFSRILIAAILVIAGVLCILPIGDTILNFAFMSMGLRGAVIFAPLCCALWLKYKVKAGWVLVSIIVSPIIVLVFGLLNILPFDPLFLG